MSTATAALPRRPADRAVIWAVLALCAMGVLAVYSAVSFLAETKSGGDTEAFLFRHLVRVALALGGGEEGIEVETSEARVRTITQTVSASGTVASEVEVAISSDVSGEIIFLAVEEGDRVQQGDLLLLVRPDFYATEAERARLGRALHAAAHDPRRRALACLDGAPPPIVEG